ncbi:MAG: hypothetical protein AAGC70_10880 [Pseudomonadota bacterium]
MSVSALRNSALVNSGLSNSGLHNIVGCDFGAPPGGTAMVPEHDLTPDDAKRLKFLRILAEQSQLRSRRELEQMCWLIAAERSASATRYGLALFGALAEYARQRLVFHARDSAIASDDEIWLLRTLRAYEDAETPNGRALVSWRVMPEGRRRIRFLVGGLAEALKEDHEICYQADKT